MRRLKSFDQELSRRLRKPAYAQGFLTTLMEGPEGLDAAEALRQMIRIMGIKEFAQLTGFPAPNLVAFAKGRRNFKPETLDLLLRPFRLRTRVVLEKAP